MTKPKNKKISHVLHLRRAVELAERSLYSVTDNPHVGCLLVRDGRVLARGVTHPVGGLHAEADALRNAEEDVHGATAYVSMEPCCHTGRQPPCTLALIEAGIVRVVAAMEDPNPRVAGQGFAALRKAGVEVVLHPLPEAEALNAGFARRVRGGAPFVRVKIATSLDGKTAMASGESQWITSAEARSDVQHYRARSGAVVTGIGTVLADDPALNVREERFAWDGHIRQPIRVIADSTGRTPPNAKILEPPGEAIIVTGHAAPSFQDLPEHVDVVHQESERVDLPALFAMLGTKGCNEILLEAGATLTSSCLEQRLWDEVVVYMAPKILGKDARSMTDASFEHLSEALGATIADVSRVGDDLKIILTP